MLFMRRYIAIGAAIGTVLGTIIGKIWVLLKRFFRFVFSLISEKVSERREEKEAETSIKNHTRTINCVTPFQQYYLDKYKKMEAEGKKIEWYYVEQTTNSNYPYPCATEDEKDFMDDGKEPLKDGYLPAAYWAMIYYGVESNDYLYYDPDKKAYWKNYIVTNAKNGDRWCQALLVAAEKGFMQSDAWCTPEENAQWKELYEDTLINDARFGDPRARIGVAWAGLDGTRNDDEKKERYYRMAGESGYGDGYVLLAKHIELKDFNETGEVYTYGDAKSCAYYNLIKQAAETNNGVLAGWCQDTIGSMYLSGECGFEKNPQKAKAMYEQAIENEYEPAISSLDTLKSLYGV